MSPASIRRLHRESRHVCAACKVQPARFRYHGRVRADRDHNLCFRCYRAEVNRARAHRMARQVPEYRAIGVSVPPRTQMCTPR